VDESARNGPRFVTLDEMFGGSAAGDGLAAQALQSRLAAEPVGLPEVRPAVSGEFRIPSVRPATGRRVFSKAGAPPSGLGEKFYAYMEELGLDVAAFDRVLADHGYESADLDRRDVWEEDAFYLAMGAAFVEASIDYEYALDRRPDTVSVDIRVEIRRLAAEYADMAGNMEVGRS